MKLALVKGSTSVSVTLFIQDSSSTTGAGLTGLVYNSAGLVASYVQPRGTATAISLQTLAAANSAYASGGFKEIDSANLPGFYRLDLPNAALTGADFVSIGLKGAANMAPVALEIQLTGADLNNAASLGLANLDAAISSRLATSGYTTPPTVGAIADAVWDEATAGHSTPSTFGSLVIGIDQLLETVYTTVQTNLASILNVLGIQGVEGFSGVGDSTVFGFFRALFRKDVTAPADIGGTYAPATDSLEALAEQGASTATVVNNINNSVTQIVVNTTGTPAAVSTLASDAGRLVLMRGDTWSAALTGLGDIGSRDKLWFTVKTNAGDADSAALIQIEESAGLLYLAGAAGTAGQGSLTVTDEDAGDVALALAAAASAQLTPGNGYEYDVQMKAGSVVSTLATGTFRVYSDLTRATS